MSVLLVVRASQQLVWLVLSSINQQARTSLGRGLWCKALVFSSASHLDTVVTTLLFLIYSLEDTSKLPIRGGNGTTFALYVLLIVEGMNWKTG